MTGCSPCPVGTYNSNPGQISVNSCQSCVTGSYPSDDRDKCIPCEPGLMSTTTATSASSCIPCDDQQLYSYLYTATYPATACTACAVDMPVTQCDCPSTKLCNGYILFEGIAFGTCSCCKGQHVAAYKRTLTYPFFRVINTWRCVPCIEGTYSDTTTDIWECTACSAGKFNLYIGLSSCTECFAGTYKANTGSGLCQSCLSNSNSDPGSSTWSRGLGWRMHESGEDTKLSTNKQHTLASATRATRGSQESPTAARVLRAATRDCQALPTARCVAAASTRQASVSPLRVHVSRVRRTPIQPIQHLGRT
jgi:hypothetical protein